MQLKLDTSKTYAIALEGGGAKGAYEIGAWKALEEAGIKYNAVSGTSVGALNGALMAMRDLPRAETAWNDMRLSKVIELDKEGEEDLHKAMNGELELGDIQELIPQMFEIIRNRGLDVAPLRAWVREVVDVKKVKKSDVELFVSTVSLTDRKGLEIKINDLPEDEICDMLLASAWERRFRMPDDVNVTTIHTNADLGFVLNFDAEQSRRDMAIGYLDAQRVLYGLYGQKYYIDRTMTDREALEWLLDHCAEEGENLRAVCEKELPRLARKLNAEDGDYYELMAAKLEQECANRDIDNMRIYTDKELIALAW